MLHIPKPCLLLQFNPKNKCFEFHVLTKHNFDSKQVYDTCYIIDDENFTYVMNETSLEDAKILLAKFAKHWVDYKYHLFRNRQGAIIDLQNTLSKETGSGGDQPASGSERRER